MHEHDTTTKFSPSLPFHFFHFSPFQNYWIRKIFDNDELLEVELNVQDGQQLQIDNEDFGKKQFFLVDLYFHLLSSQIRYTISNFLLKCIFFLYF